MILAAACAALSLIPFAPARAKVIPSEISCTASGSAEYWGNWEGDDVWHNIDATGLCVGPVPSTFSVTLTGDGSVSQESGVLHLMLALTDTHSGRSATYRQTWTCIVSRAIILASNGVPAGFGRLNAGLWFNDYSSQELAFAWTFLAWQTP